MGLHPRRCKWLVLNRTSFTCRVPWQCLVWYLRIFYSLFVSLIQQLWNATCWSTAECNKWFEFKSTLDSLTLIYCMWQLNYQVVFWCLHCFHKPVFLFPLLAGEQNLRAAIACSKTGRLKPNHESQCSWDESSCLQRDALLQLLLGTCESLWHRGVILSIPCGLSVFSRVQ